MVDWDKHWRLSLDGEYRNSQLGRDDTFSLIVDIVLGLHINVKYSLLDAERRYRATISDIGLPTGCLSRLTSRLP